MPYLKRINTDVPYSIDPSLVFNIVCDEKTNIVLLESADIGSKNATNSILFVSSAVKIKAIDNVITYQAINYNGKVLLDSFFHYLKNYIDNYKSNSTIELNNDLITLTIIDAQQSLNEDDKLHDLNIFSGLRSIQKFFANEDDEVMFSGLFSYDIVLEFINITDNIIDNLDCPTYVFYLADQVIHYNHKESTAILNSFAFSSKTLGEVEQSALEIKRKIKENLPIIKIKNQTLDNKDIDIKVNLDDSSFKNLIIKLKDHLYAGDVFQIVPSRQFNLPCLNPLSAYIYLKETNPSPYMFYLKDDEFSLFGASPESAMKFNPLDRQVEVYPIAGSRPRGLNKDGTLNRELDSRLELELRLDAKEQAEHLMLVDLARNDIARISVPGSRTVLDLMTVDKYSHIMHLVSRVVGTLKPELDAFHAYQASMNMGTLTGSPKIKAMSLLYKYEKQKRGYYGGAVGYFGSKGIFDTCIVIRSAFIKNNVAYVSAGAGCVIDSDPQAEADETTNKAKAVLNAIVNSQINIS